MYSGPNIQREGLIFGYDTGYGLTNSNNSTTYYRGRPAVNLVSDPVNMSGWSSYSSGNDGTFLTEFGTIGYKINRRNTWNGIVKGVGLPSPGTYTISAWFRIRGKSSGNNGINVYTSGGGIGDTAAGGNDGLFGEWQRISMTRTYTTTSFNFYIISWGGTSGVDWSSWDVTMPQVEAGSILTPFANGTRSVTDSLRDIKRTATLSLANVSFNGSGQPTFDGSDDSIVVSSNLGTLSQYTIEHVSYKGSENRMPIASAGGPLFYQYGDNSWYYTHGGSAAEYYYPKSFSINGWGHWTIVYNGSYVRIYRNGIFEGQRASSGTANWTNGITIGRYASGGYYWNGDIATVKMYNRALSDQEVKNNYLGYKGRFNLS